MNRIQQDALRRAGEMHRRSFVSTPHYSQGSPHQENFSSPPPRQNDSRDLLNKLSSYVSLSNIDSDKLMILAVMGMLLSEGADMKLILALAYILL